MNKFLTIGLILLIIIINLRVETHSNTYGVCNSIRINEILANPAGADSGNEWLELYNCSTDTINLDNWKIRDKSYNTQTLEDITVNPNEYFIIYPSFSLNQSDEEVILLNSQGEIVDQMSYEETKEDKSWARIPDGIGGWVLEEPSPEKTNTQPPTEYNIIISEIYPSPETGENEWIELYNNSENTVDISNWTIEDTTNKHTIVDLYISPFSYIVIENLSITLNNSGDSIQIKDPDNNLAHALDYEETTKGQSVIWNDGQPIHTRAVTKGAKNLYVSSEDKFYDLEHYTIEEAKENNYEAPFVIAGKLLSESKGFIENKAYIHDKDHGILVNIKDINVEKYDNRTIQLCGTMKTYYGNPIFSPISGCIREAEETIEPQIMRVTSSDLKSYTDRLIQIEGMVKNIEGEEGILIADAQELKFRTSIDTVQVIKANQKYFFTGILNAKVIKGTGSYTLFVTKISNITEIEESNTNTETLGITKASNQLVLPTNLKTPSRMVAKDVFIPHKVETEYRKNSKPLISGVSVTLSLLTMIFVIKENYIQELHLDLEYPPR